MGERDELTLLTRAQQAGLLREGVDPASVAEQIVALIAGHRQVCDLRGDRAELRRRVHDAWHLLLPAIATDTWLADWRGQG